MWSHATWKVDSPNVSTRNNLKLRNVNVYKQSRQVIDFETTINRCFTFPIKWILVACCLHGRPCKASNQKTTRKSKPATFSNNLLHIMWKICAQGWQTWTFTHGYHEIHSCQKPINANNKLEDGPHMYLKVLEPKWNRKRSRWEFKHWSRTTAAQHALLSNNSAHYWHANTGAGNFNQSMNVEAVPPQHSMHC